VCSSDLAAVIVEREFKTATVHQGYIEPHTATAVWHEDGKLTIYTSTQGAFSVRQQVAELLDIPMTNIKVVPMEIGGGFGGKIVVYTPPVAAMLSKKTGRPVKVVMDRAGEGFGDQPVDPCLGQGLAQGRQGRDRPCHVPQRGGPNDQNTLGRGFA